MYYLSVICVFTSLVSISQVPFQIGARSAALSNAVSNLEDEWAVKNNPGVLGFVQKSSIATEYKNRYLIKELSVNQIASVFTLRQSGYGFYIQHSGFSLYNEMQVGFGYGLKLSKSTAIGTSLGYYRLKLGDIYGVSQNVFVSLGIKQIVTEKLSLSTAILNLTNSRISKNNPERKPSIMVFGLAWIANGNSTLLLDIEKTFHQKISFRTGLEIDIDKHVTVRLGYSSYPVSTSFGFALKLNKIQFDLASSWHVQLGLSPSIGLKYEL